MGEGSGGGPAWADARQGMPPQRDLRETPAPRSTGEVGKHSEETNQKRSRGNSSPQER